MGDMRIPWRCLVGIKNEVERKLCSAKVDKSTRYVQICDPELYSHRRILSIIQVIGGISDPIIVRASP